jgi:hypothetical protein
MQKRRRKKECIVDYNSNVAIHNVLCVGKQWSPLNIN